MSSIQVKMSRLTYTQYFDHDFTGTHDDCQSVEIGVTSLTEFTQWARGASQARFLG